MQEWSEDFSFDPFRILMCTYFNICICIFWVIILIFR